MGARSFLSLLSLPFQYTVDFPARATHQMSEYFTTRHQLRAENRQLKEERTDLLFQQQKLESLHSENARLRALLQSSAQITEKALVAELLRVSSDPFSQRVVLNKGSNNGVYIGQPALDAHGVMGQIIQVNPLTSVALLITDMSHAVPVQDNRSGVRGIASGIGARGMLELKFITTTADIVPGDLMVTSGLGGRFPAGYPVGIVESVETETGDSFARIIIKPAAQLDRSREVLLIWESQMTVQQQEMLKESQLALENQKDAKHD